VPEIPAGDPEATASDAAPGDHQSSPDSTTGPNPETSSSTSDTP
jgi:hypothetical protein